MATIIIALGSGLIFSLGLVISGMTNPNKVIGFLDVFGKWDYSLAFVMAGAILVTAIFFKLSLKSKPFCADKHSLPEKVEIDKRLLLGSALFGLGWGWTGFCPGPALLNLSTNNSSVFLFVVSMLVGIIIFQKLEKNINSKDLK